MNYVQLLEKVKEELIRFFHTHEKIPLLYHNFSHTKSVVVNAGHIARHYQLNDHDYFVVVTAAWFHDTGYYTGGAANHEMAGAEMASAFLKEHHLDDQSIEAVRQCILATKMPQTPHNLLEEIICDADLYHFGTDDFLSSTKYMRKEMELRTGQKIAKHDWRTSNIQLLESHHFKTEYARQMLNEKKQQTINELKEKNKEQDGHEAEATATAEPETAKTILPIENTYVKVKPGKEKDKPSRGIETMFRISSSNHQRLSDMADNKAHIMITTTSIILSVLLSLLLRKLEDNPHLIFPTFLLLMVCVVTMVFSILATRPTLPHGTFTKQDLEEKKVNLLFFGNFYRMGFEDYNEGMIKMMNDSEFLYGSLTKDLYSQGLVLGRKYQLLRKAYNIFMFGIVASVVAFSLAVTFFK